MALITDSNTLGTPFTPAVGDFVIQVTGGVVQLQRRNADAAAWAPVEGGIMGPGAYDATQRVAGVDWQFTAPPGGTAAVVRADQ